MILTARRAEASLDERFGTRPFLREAVDAVFPDHWSFMLGETAFYCFALLVGSGLFLAFFYDPSDVQVVYHGRYLPLAGQKMSLAYESTLRLSLDVRAGLFARQVHHWAGDLFLAVVVAHLLRVFFTGAFRKPRELNWVVGVTMFILAMLNGFTGYTLPDDLLSGDGLRIGYSVLESIPVVGNWLASLLLGGQYPSPQITPRLFVAHVLVLPGLIGALLAAHLGLVWRQRHAQFPRAGEDGTRAVGTPWWPTYMARTAGVACAVAGTVFALGGLAQINPIWLYGPYDPAAASSSAQPDWYVGWLEGALSLFPAWRLHLFGYTVSELFWPAVAFPVVAFGILLAWPLLERWRTGDRSTHHLLDWPRDRPGRTAFGAGGLTLFAVLFVAGGQDVLAEKLQTSQPPVTLTLRGLAIGLPLAVGAVTWKLCRERAGSRRPSAAPPLPVAPLAAVTPVLEDYLPDAPKPPPVRLKTLAGVLAALGIALVVRRLRSGRQRTGRRAR